MGNCGSGLNCHPPSDGTLDANADIVGYGVLVSFFLTAAATIGAIIWGYLSDSLPESYLNELDVSAIEAFQDSWFSKVVICKLARGRHMATQAVRRLLGSHSLESRPEVPRAVREEALTKFMLVMSDQQLVTGLAILIGAVTNQCTLTTFEFSVVMSLAWFSSTTHLATLDALREYFRAHHVVRNWRVGGMVSLLVLLTYAVILTTLSLSSATERGGVTPIQCFFLDGFSNKDRSAFMPLAVSSTILALVLVISSYVARILVLYVEEGDANWYIAKLVAKFRRQQRQSLTTLDEDERLREFRQALLVHKAKMRREDLDKISRASRWVRMCRLSYFRYADSLLYSVPGVVFSFCYGISQIISNRWFLSPKLSSGTTSMDFGQIVPLLLLALPVLAAAEIYYDFRDEASNKRKSTLENCQDDSTTHLLSMALPSPAIHLSHLAPSTAQGPSPKVMPNIVSMTAVTPQDQFKGNLPLIKKFFYAEARSLLDLGTHTLDELALQEMDQSKSSLVMAALELKRFEDSLSIRPALTYFWINVLISAVLGIMLNLTINDNLYALLISVILFVVQFSASLVGRRCRYGGSLVLLVGYDRGVSLGVSAQRN